MKPFILQFFGSAAPLLQSEEENNPQKISQRSLFKLIASLEEDTKDKLDILELVTGEKPLKTLDFCYSSETASNFSIMEAIRLCVIVVAYSPDSIRGAQMLTVLDALVPQLLKHMKEETKKKDNSAVATKAERETITTLSVSIKSLITGADSLAKSTSGPRRIDTANTNASFKSSGNSQQGNSVRNISRKSGFGPGGIDLGDEDMREDFKFKYNDERVRRRYEDDSDDAEPMNEFRKPRDMLLSVVCEYYCHSHARMKELRPGNEIKVHSSLELLDHKCHLRVAEVAHSLLKVAPHDPITMGCKGLQRYITKMIPKTDWSNQDLRPALILILKRLDKLFQKIHKKPTLMRHMDWKSVANFLKGVYLTLTRQSIISHLPQLKSLLNICLALLLCDGSQASGGDGGLFPLLTMTNTTPAGGVRFTPPPVFCSAVVRVVAMQMHCMKHQYWIKPKDLYTLEQVFGGMSVFNTAERTETILLYLVLPLCLRVGCGRKDSPKIRPSDISFALTVMINAMLPPKSGTRHPTPPGTTAPSCGPPKPGMAGDMPAHTNMTYIDTNAVVTDTLYEAGFLGLKLMIVCFENSLSREWFRIASAVKQLGEDMRGGIALWSFLDFCISFRTPLYIMLKSFVAFKMRKMICETDHEMMMQRYVIQRLQSNVHHVAQKSKAELMLQLVAELRHLRDNMFLPRDQMKIDEQLAALTGQHAQVFEEMEVISPFTQSNISRLTRKETINYRRPSQRGPSVTRRSYRVRAGVTGGIPNRGGSNPNQEIPEATENNTADPFNLTRTGSFGKRSMHQADTTISEADDEAEKEEQDNLGSPLKGFTAARRHTTKRLGRRNSQRQRCPPPEKMNLKEEIRENVVLLEDPLIEKSDDDIEDGSNEQSRLLKSATPSQKHHTFAAPVTHTDTEDDMEGNQETMRLLDMDKEPEATIAGRGGSAGKHDTRV